MTNPDREQITMDMKCTKCGVTLRSQAFMAMMIDAGARTLDPSLCPEGGDHDFVSPETYCVESLARQAAKTGKREDLQAYLKERLNR